MVMIRRGYMLITSESSGLTQKKVSFSAAIVTICSIKIMTSCVDHSKSIKPFSKRI